MYLITESKDKPKPKTERVKPIKYLLGRPIYPDITGAHIICKFLQHTILGEVTSVYLDNVGFTKVKAKYFSGEHWPIEPCITEIEILIREYEKE